MTSSAPNPRLERLPTWLRRPLGNASEMSTVQRLVKERQIHTICEEGRCPNRGECYANRTATFLLMGSVCTRACAFCQVDKGHAPMTLDPHEPEQVAESVQLLGLRYVVLTSVARDDLPDHGAGWFVQVMDTIRQRNPQTAIEVLTPDFWGGPSREAGQAERVQTVVAANPACYNHNLETVRRLQDPVRRGVLHQGDLTYAIVMSQGPGEVGTNSLANRHQVYRTLCQFLIEGWKTLGVPLDFGQPSRDYGRSPNCFALATSADLVDAQGHKVIGSAQLRRGSYLLQHGSLGLAPDADLWQQVFQTPAPPPTQAQTAMVNGVTVAQVIAALTQAAQDCFNCHLLPQPLTPAEWQAVKAWAQRHGRNDDGTDGHGSTVSSPRRAG